MKLEMWPIERLKPYPLNSKIHDKAQVSKIAASIKMSGFDQPIVVDKNDVIIKGHGRRLACMELGLKTVPVIVRDDLTEDQVNVARLADNRVALGGVDIDKLHEEMAQIDLNSLIGIFDDKELAFLEADLGTMNEDFFVDDITEATNAAQEQLKADMQGVTEKRIALAKAFGFKDIKGESGIYLSRFMARAEGHTGVKEDAALIAYLNHLEKRAGVEL